MQKARGQAFVLRRIALPPLVGKRFQVLFHSPHRGSFRRLQLSSDFVTLRATPYQRPATPDWLAPIRFRLFPFRSPLLRESSFLSLPRGTEMFQFPRFASRHLWIQ